MSTEGAIALPDDPIIFLNGRFLKQSKARVSALDRGLLFADGLFETLAVAKGRGVDLEAHLERLAKGARTLDLRFDASVEGWVERISKLAEVNRCGDATFVARITLTAGSGAVVDRGPVESPTLIVHPRPFPRTSPRGLAVHVVDFARTSPGPLAELKSTAYLSAVVARRLARAAKADEALYSRGAALLEGTTSNLFIVRRDELRTPTLRSGVLPGVVRMRTLEAARELGIPTREGRVTRDDLRGSDGAFLTSSVMGTRMIRRFGDSPVSAAAKPMIDAIRRQLTSKRQIVHEPALH